MNGYHKIFLVDDDKIFLLTAKFSLKRVFPNADIQSFNNAEEAISRLIKEKPDLLLLDLNMPVMDGWTFLEELEQRGSAVTFPIYIVSSSIDPSDISRANEHDHVMGFIEKPLDERKVKVLMEKK
jgi:CheY-like chemotaxis protein